MVKFNAAKRALAEASSVNEVKSIRDKAEAIIAEMEKAKGVGDGSNQYRKSYRSHDATGRTLTLSDIGITKTQSSRWQQIASIPERIFERFIKDTKRAEEELTTKREPRLHSPLKKNSLTK
jgi:hypothetical protein